MTATHRPDGEPASLLRVAVTRGARQRRLPDAGSPAPPVSDHEAPPAAGSHVATAPVIPTPDARPDAGKHAVSGGRSYRSLRHYWRRLGGGALPRVDALDDAVVGTHWPGSVLFEVLPDGALTIASVFDRTTGGERPAQQLLANDLLSEGAAWMIELARTAAGASAPAEAAESFAFPHGWERYRAAAVPLRDDADTDVVRYVLLAVAEA